jgi:sporulation protein YunB
MSAKGFQSVRSSPTQGRRSPRRPHWSYAILLSILACALLMLYALNVKIRPAIAAGAKAVATRAANAALNKAVTEELARSAAAENIVHYNMNRTGDLKVADFDFAYVTKVQSAATQLAENYLADLSDETLRFPIAQTFGGAVFSTLGPAIPVRVNLVGSAHSSVSVESKSVGINQTVHILYLQLNAEVQVVAPLVAQPVSVQSRVPLAYVVFNGQVPNTFYGGWSQSPALPPTSSGQGGH